ncbi:MAG TPA: GGDEF domain-containing protein [Anaerolineales bacterium]|nr:GGDEF domain-containing protein [Anaerolineales bacterium]
MTEDRIATLKAIDIFQSLTDEMLHNLSDRLQTVSLEAGEVLFNKGDQGDSLYLVQSGIMKIVSTNSEGHEVILNQVRDGGIVGEMALIDQEPRSAGVIAIQPSVLLKLSSEDFMEIIQATPAIGLMISRNLTQRLRQNTTQIENAVPTDALEARIEARTADLARDNQKLKEMATIDPLTQVFNRRHFFELAQQALQQSQQDGRSIAAIMVDLDHFKAINDTYGHRAGDQVLQAAAQFIQASIRENDILARYGGEEFAVVLPNTTLDEATEIAERICTHIDSQSVQVDETVIPITASVGVAGFLDASELDTAHLLDRADQALYQAKNTGRNRVAVWQA